MMQSQTQSTYTEKEFRPDAYEARNQEAPVLTVDDLIRSVKRHILALRGTSRLPVGIEVDVIEKFLPAAAYVLLREKEPTKPLAMLLRLAGVAALRASKYLEERR